MLKVVLVYFTLMAFSHIRDDVSSKQEDKLHRFPPKVGLAKAHPNKYMFASTLVTLLGM